MSIQLQSVTFASPDPQLDAEFWRAVLGRQLHRDGEGILLPGTAGQVGIRFVIGDAHGNAKNRLHLHLTEADRDQQATIAECLRHGAKLLGNGHVPENSYAVMADVVGDEFCVIEDGNGNLAGCGPLGEVTCSGTRDVGIFWSQALGWPLVWDQDEETVIQSEFGGTKIAWSGSFSPETPRDRQFFVLTVPSDEFNEEIERLVALGAARLGSARIGETSLGDPDGNDFVLRASAVRQVAQTL